MKELKKPEVWFVTGSQHLYGKETLLQVANHSIEIAGYMNRIKTMPVQVVFKPVLTTPEAITRLCRDAGNTTGCIGLITWMHTFSPAKMWITGLSSLKKPFVHLHTQYNRDIPWKSIDMDFMNLNQSAHGDREFGFIGSRLRLARKVIVGHWKDKEVHERLVVWARAASAWHDSQELRIARFGDNMREVAVTEGDKVAAQMKFGYSVYGYGVGDLVEKIRAVPEKQVNQLMEEYRSQYNISVSDRKKRNFNNSLKEAAKVEAGMRSFLEEGGFRAFTTTFEDLHGLQQLPGLAVQRLMESGYGFGAEGDWKTAALVRAMKVMANGLPGGVSFMEDYTYHFDPREMQVLGAHMLEVCPSIAGKKPSLGVYPLSIGGKADPARLLFDVAPGKGLNASLMDVGNRFRLLVNAVNVRTTPSMPKLPVARVLWEPLPDLKTAAQAWILAGGAHHTGFTKALTPEYLEDFAEMAGIEFLIIDKKTTISDFKKEIRNNEIYFLLKDGFRN